MLARLALAAALVGLALAGPGRADTVSSAPDAVTVTVYRDHQTDTFELGQDESGGLALIIETRTVDLPAGRMRVRFEGVADGIIPQSAAVEGLPGTMAERNFDYDLLSPGAVIARLVGQPVRIVRTDRKTGAQTTHDAVLRSGPSGVVLQTAQGFEALRCDGGPEKLVFDHLPGDLADRPTLSVVTETPKAGRYTVRVSYLTTRVGWSADYIARVHSGEDRLDLTGWITLANWGGVSFVNAPTAVVAGHLARQPVDLPKASSEQVENKCWPMGTTHGDEVIDSLQADEAGKLLHGGNALQRVAGISIHGFRASPAEVIVTARRKPALSNLGDYKVYTLAEPTTVAAHQTKQVQFLDQSDVKFERVYRYSDGDLYDDDRRDVTEPTDIILKFNNKDSEGLGLPIPAGDVSVHETNPSAPDRALFVDAAHLRTDVPVGQPFELNVGQSSEVEVRRVGLWRTYDGSRAQAGMSLIAVNHHLKPVVLEVWLASDSSLSVLSESTPHEMRYGHVVWRLQLSAGGSTSLSYSAETDRR